MEDLLKRVKKELYAIADKGITSSNLESTYKLIDIYKDIKEAEYYDKMSGNMNNVDKYNYLDDGNASERVIKVIFKELFK